MGGSALRSIRGLVRVPGSYSMRRGSRSLRLKLDLFVVRVMDC